MVRAVVNLGHWHGTRHGIKIELALLREQQPAPKEFRENQVYVTARNVVQWRARIRKEWKQGKAESVYKAIDAIEAAAGESNT